MTTAAAKRNGAASIDKTGCLADPCDASGIDRATEIADLTRSFQEVFSELAQLQTR